MVKRFSIKAFIFATGVHLARTIAVLEASFHILREAKHSGVELDRVWLTAVSWIWEFLPMFVAHAFPPAIIFYMPILLAWSFCVGVFFRFFIPRFFLWRRRTI
jgi:hypothetical protein